MKIKNQKNIAEISDLFPTITEWLVDGIDILFPEQNMLINGQYKKRGGIPICFPNFGKPVMYGEVEIPQHGFLRDTENILYHGKTESHFAVMSGMVEAYGLSYSTRIKMQVYKEVKKTHTLTQEICIRSGDDSKRMPLCLGFHPYFKVNRKYLDFMLDGKSMNMKIFSDKKFLQAQKFDFKNLFEIQLDEHLTVVIRCLGDFETGHQQICIWSDNPDKYICIEPIIHKPELFGTPQGHFVGYREQKFQIIYTCKIW